MAANTEVNVKINVDAKGADTSVGNIKKQLRDATKELITMREKFGDSSAEAVNAAKKVAELKDAIGDAKAMTDAFDPDAKFKAFGAALQGVAGGFAAVQGAQALFGAESEDVAKVLAKVQGAMALSQGINSVLQAKDAFKNLGAVLSNNVLIQKALNFVMNGSFKTQQQMIAAKEADVVVTETQTSAQIGLTTATSAGRVAMIALRGAIMATGIGALVIGVMALISAISNLISGEEDSKAAIEASNAALEQQQKKYKEVSDQVKYNYEIKVKQAELEGKSQAEIYNIQKEGSIKSIKLAKENADILYKQYSDFFDARGKLHDDGNATFREKDYEQLEKLKKAKDDADAELLSLQRQYTKDTLDEQKRLHSLQLQGESELTNLQQQNYLNSIKDDNLRNKEKSRIDFENAKKSLQEKGYNKNLEGQLLKELEIKNNNEIDKINSDAADKAKQKRDEKNKEIAAANSNLNKQILALNNELALLEIKNEDDRAKKKLLQQYEIAQQDIENSKAEASVKAEALKAIKLKYEADVKAIDDAAAKKAEEKRKEDEAKALEQRQKNIDFDEETFRMREEARIARIQDEQIKATETESLRYQSEIDAALKLYNDKEIGAQEYARRREVIEQTHQGKLTEITNQANEERKKQDEAAYQAKLAQWSEIGGLAQQLSGIIGETTAVGKGLALSQIAIDTGLAISSLTKNSEANPTNAATFGAAGAIQFATGLIRILANIKKAKDLLTQAKVPAKGGGGGDFKMPSGGGATIAPIAPTLNTTMLNQSQINQLSSATARAYVVESDVTGSQERIQRLNRAARIN